MPTTHADATLIIDLDAIASNYRYLRDKAASAECTAVVKANAYGLGVEPVARKLAEEGCQRFFVATLDEALELRDILPDHTIYIFHGFRNGQEQLLLEHKLIPVLNTLEQLEQWNRLSSLQAEQLPAILHIDTGMNRLGLSIQEAEVLNADDYSHINLHYIMSHLACISQPDHPLNKEQLKRVNHIRKHFPGIPVSLCNSGGVMSDTCYHFQMVRPGCALYGINSLRDTASPLKQVVTLTAKIIQIREIDTPQTVGYGATHKVAAGSRLATVPVGYADGYLRCLSNQDVYGIIHGTHVPIVGRVSMDMVILDITGRDDIATGDEVELLGDSFTVDQIAAQANTIGYETLTRLGSRYKRIYING